jgi:hypothetical protein
MKNLEVQMGQLSTDLGNATRTGFSGTTLDNPRNETCKMMEATYFRQTWDAKHALNRRQPIFVKLMTQKKR